MKQDGACFCGGFVAMEGVTRVTAMHLSLVQAAEPTFTGFALLLLSLLLSSLTLLLLLLLHLNAKVW